MFLAVDFFYYCTYVIQLYMLYVVDLRYAYTQFFFVMIISAEQYKCPLCTYKDSTKDSFQSHFTEKHPDNPIDIITTFYKADEIEQKPTTNKPDLIAFDTTPLWQRDKQRVRHIRGILFDESGKMPKKPLIKLQFDSVKPPNNNLDRSIESVVNHSDDLKTTTTTPTPTKKRKREESVGGGVDNTGKSCNEQKIEALDKQINESLNNIMSRGIAGEKEKEKEKDVIIIDDDSGGASAGGGDGDDEETMGTFGPFGKPMHNKFLCPLCARFKTRNSDVIRLHLYEELQYYR